MAINQLKTAVATALPGALTPEAIAVRGALLARGLETPMTANGLSRDERYDVIRASFTQILDTLGLDLQDDSLEQTPHRIAKMYVDEIFSGLDYAHFPKITMIENKMKVEEMVCVEDIDLTSTCEHHFVTIDGSAKVAYIPKDTVIGLSKINRLVRFFSQRPQVQERLTRQIAEALKEILDTEDVAVVIEAKHLCVSSRGIEDEQSSTVTADYHGAFANEATRREFLDHIRG